MAEQTNHSEIEKHLAKIREGITENREISREEKSKALDKLDVVQSHLDDNKVSESTTQHLRDIIQHLEEKPNLLALVEEALTYLPH